VQARPIGVEDADQVGVYAAITVIGRHQRLGIALCFVVDGAGTNRIHIAPIVFGLGMDEGVAVALRGGGVEITGAIFGGGLKGVFRARGAYT
jgi:hypothetical protein